MKKLITFALLVAATCFGMNLIPKLSPGLSYSMNAEASAAIAELLETNEGN